MKKLILISVVAMSVLVARDCRYEEQELNMLIRQYEDLQDEAEYEAKHSNAEMYRNTMRARLENKDPR